MPRRSRIVLALAGLSLAALGLAGCKTEVLSAPADSITLDTVTASGSGTALAAPDTAEMTFGTLYTDPKAKPALDRASKAAGDVAAALKKAGVAEADIQTSDMRIEPNYTYDNSGEKPPTVVSYRASVTLRVRVRDIASVGEVIEAATGAGASTVNGPTFTLEDDAAATDEAITKAVEDAKRRAEAMAKAAGKSVGEAVTVKETAIDVPEVYTDSALLRADKGAYAAGMMPVESGQLDIKADITVVFRLK